MNWYLEVLRKYADFNGRARRQEYWMFYLFNFIIAFVIGIFEGSFGSPGTLGTLYSLLVIIPAIAVSVRRSPSQSGGCMTPTAAAGGC